MQVVEHLNVDADSLFRLIKESILTDIEEAHGRKAKASNVHTGYSYKKYLKGKRDADHAVQVRITAWRPPTTYSCSIEGASGTTTISYDVVPGGDGGIDVTYTEEFEGAGATEGVVSKATGALRASSGKRKIRRQLHNMEESILADRYVEAAAGK